MVKKIIGIGIIIIILIGILVVFSSSEYLNFSSLTDDGVHTYSIQKIPQYADSQVVQSAITEGINMWETRNPDLDFKQVESGGDFQIIWVIEIDKITGTGDHLGYYDGKNIAIEIGNKDCNNRWQHYSRQSIADTITHEIGHYLGLKHHANKSHLMYGFGDPKTTQDPYDDLGYAIPFKNQDYQKWIVSENLDNKIIKIQGEIDILQDRYEKLSNEYKQYPRVIEDRDTYEEAEKLFNELQGLNNQINKNIDEYNTLAEKINCVTGYKQSK
jgi:hypothetical protein